MNRLEADRKPAKNGLASAYTNIRDNLSSATTRFVDLTSDQMSYGIRPSTSIQLDQIKALNDFNSALPKKKQSMAFPMIAATNIGTSNFIKRDHKKKTAELITKYNPIGLLEDHFNTGDELSDSKFSLGSKVRSVS